MFGKLIRILLPSRNTIRIDSSSKLQKGRNVSIVGSEIQLNNNSELIIGSSVNLNHVRIILNSGKMVIGDSTSLDGIHNPLYMVDNGSLKIGKCSYIRCAIFVRFGGSCTIGDYNTINHESEIRCDESVSIGSFNMISWGCQVNDTNTHNVLPVEERRAQTMREFPTMGAEHKKPPTKPVVIGDDCWFGKNVTVLKGVTIGKAAVIGTQAVVTKHVPDYHFAAGNPAVVIRKLDEHQSSQTTE